MRVVLGAEQGCQEEDFSSKLKGCCVTIVFLDLYVNVGREPRR